MVQAFVKDPNAVLDYEVDWSGWLASGDTISTSTWVASDGITIDSDSKTTTKTTVWLSGGVAGRSYAATNHIVTAAGREDDRTIVMRVAER